MYIASWFLSKAMHTFGAQNIVFRDLCATMKLSKLWNRGKSIRLDGIWSDRRVIRNKCSKYRWIATNNIDIVALHEKKSSRFFLSRYERSARRLASRVLAYKPLGHDYLKNTRFYFKCLASYVFRQFLNEFISRFRFREPTGELRRFCKFSRMRSVRFRVSSVVVVVVDRERNIVRDLVRATLCKSNRTNERFVARSKRSVSDRNIYRVETIEKEVRFGLFKDDRTNFDTCQENSRDFLSLV